MASTWDEAEFESIFREHFPRLVRIARRVLRSDGEAEEVCADAFLKLYRSGPGVQAGGAVGAWLYRVATRAAIDRLRTNRRRGLEEEWDAEKGAGTGDCGEDPLTRLIRQEHICEVRLTLARLKPEKAQLLLLRHSGLSYEEVATVLGIKAGSVGTLLARAEAEFSHLYEKQQRRGQTRSHLHLSAATPKHPSDQHLTLRTPKEG